MHMYVLFHIVPRFPAFVRFSKASQYVPRKLFQMPVQAARRLALDGPDIPGVSRQKHLPKNEQERLSKTCFWIRSWISENWKGNTLNLLGPVCFARFKSIYSYPFSRIIPPENQRSFEAPGSPAIVGTPGPSTAAISKNRCLGPSKYL